MRRLIESWGELDPLISPKWNHRFFDLSDATIKAFCRNFPQMEIVHEIVELNPRCHRQAASLEGNEGEGGS